VVFDDGSPGHTVQWVGVPVPMIALLGYNGQQGIHPALHIFAWILNGAFASGVAHGVAYLRCARSPEPSRPS
jgi:hypothetical protein